MKQLWTTSEAAHLSGISVDMLNYFQRSGIFAALEMHSGRRGKPRFYNFPDLVLLCALGHLASSGVSVLRLKDPLATARRTLKSFGTRPLSHRFLATDGKKSRLVKADDPSGDLGKLGAAIVLIDIDRLAREVRARIAA